MRRMRRDLVPEKLRKDNLIKAFENFSKILFHKNSIVIKIMNGTMHNEIYLLQILQFLFSYGKFYQA